MNFNPISLSIFSALMRLAIERILGHTERPADIVRRRLEQAGYDVADGFELLADDSLSFLLKFVYKSQVFGPTVCSFFHSH